MFFFCPRYQLGKMRACTQSELRFKGKRKAHFFYVVWLFPLILNVPCRSPADKRVLETQPLDTLGPLGGQGPSGIQPGCSRHGQGQSGRALFWFQPGPGPGDGWWGSGPPWLSVWPLWTSFSGMFLCIHGVLKDMVGRCATWLLTDVFSFSTLAPLSGLC